LLGRDSMLGRDSKDDGQHSDPMGHDSHKTGRPCPS
jgi:hypothetical protein